MFSNPGRKSNIYPTAVKLHEKDMPQRCARQNTKHWPTKSASLHFFCWNQHKNNEGVRRGWGGPERRNMRRHALCVRKYYSVQDGDTQLQALANQCEKTLNDDIDYSGVTPILLPFFLSFFFSHFLNQRTRKPSSSRICFLQNKNHYWHFKVLRETKMLFSRQL